MDWRSRGCRTPKQGSGCNCSDSLQGLPKDDLRAGKEMLVTAQHTETEAQA